MENIENNMLAPNQMTTSVDMKYAGFWRRFVGWLIDILIITIIAHWISLGFSSIFQSQTLNVLGGPSIFSPGFFLILAEYALLNFIIIALYYCLQEASPIKATIGKYIAGIEITDMHGLRITYGKAFLRRLYSLLSILPIFIGFIVAGFTPKKQTFHDMLAKTIVVIKHKKSGGVLFGIVIITIILGILADMYLGAGFHVSFNSPTTHYDTQNGLQNYIVENGNQVDPGLQNTIIAAFVSQKVIYASGDLMAIRKHLLAALPPGSQQEKVNNMSDSDLQNLVSFYNKVSDLATEDLLRAPNTIWRFNQDKTAVKITFKTTLPNGTIETVSINELYTNGQWFF